MICWGKSNLRVAKQIWQKLTLAIRTTNMTRFRAAPKCINVTFRLSLKKKKKKINYSNDLLHAMAIIDI